jgi:hypothetical protein
MGWFKVTAPITDHCLRVRVHKAGDQDARAKAVIDLESGNEAVTETQEQVMSLIQGAG